MYERESSVTLLGDTAELTDSLAAGVNLSRRRTETIQCRAWNTCCARRRGRKPAISGFAASAASSRRSSGRRRMDYRPFASWTVGAERVRIWSCSAASDTPTASTCRRSASASAAKRDAGGSPAQRGGRAVSRRHVRRGHVVRRAVFAGGAGRAGGRGRNVPRDEAGRLRARQCRGHGVAPRRSFGAQPRGPPIQPRVASPPPRRPPASAIVRITYTNAALFLPMLARPDRSARARPRARRSTQSTRLAFRRRRSISC